MKGILVKNKDLSRDESARALSQVSQQVDETSPNVEARIRINSIGDDLAIESIPDEPQNEEVNFLSLLNKASGLSIQQTTDRLREETLRNAMSLQNYIDDYNQKLFESSARTKIMKKSFDLNKKR